MADDAIQCPRCGTRIERAADAGPVACPQCGAALVPWSDDRGVTLAAAGSEASTLAKGGPAVEESVEELLRACGSAAGRYVERGVIAQGGMGEIALCIDRNTRRQVAMKRMLPATAEDPSRRARFVEEAQVTAQLEHPNIVPVHELDRAPDGGVYFTMKLVRGRSLADILKALRAAGPLPSGEGARRSSHPGEPARAGEGAANTPGHSLTDLLAIFLKVCDGVAFAHSRGVIHRDLKPANIMVGDFGEVLVMDWGLAKIVGREDICAADLVTSSRVESDAGRTIDGSALGTPAYMPPEQADGALDKIDHRSDIYSLGAILYELLTLEKPVEGETPLIAVANAAEGKIVPPEQRAPGRAIPRELSAIAMKCLQKLRSRRYQSVGELRKDVSLFLEGRSVSAAPDTFAQGVVKLVKRNRALSVSVAAAAVVIVALTSFFVVGLKRQRDDAVAARATAEKERAAAQDARDRERTTALAASRRFAMQAVRAAETGRWDEAERRAGDADEVALRSPWGAYARGVFARMRNDHEMATKLFRDALKADPEHAESRAALSATLATMGELARAEEVIRDLSSATDWRTLLNVGETLYRAGRWRDCQAPFQRALELMEKEKDASKGLRAKTSGAVQAKIEHSQKALEKALDTARVRAACEGFEGQIKRLPAKQQIKRVVAKLNEINGTKITGRDAVIKDQEWVEVRFTESRLRFLDPLKGLPLRKLSLIRANVEDLLPLKGMPLTHLLCYHCRHVSDLTPLRGMPLTRLEVHACGGVSDLSPLAGMLLAHLDLLGARGVTDLTPLKGMPLERLSIHSTGVADLSPLQGMPIEFLVLTYAPVADLRPLIGMPLRRLYLDRTRVSDLTPLAGMKLREFLPPPKKQLTAASLELIETFEKQGCKIIWHE